MSFFLIPYSFHYQSKSTIMFKNISTLSWLILPIFNVFYIIYILNAAFQIRWAKSKNKETISEINTLRIYSSTIEMIFRLSRFRAAK